MSQTTMSGNSYYEPLRQIIQENSQENHENIKKIIKSFKFVYTIIITDFRSLWENSGH